MSSIFIQKYNFSNKHIKSLNKYQNKQNQINLSSSFCKDSNNTAMDDLKFNNNIQDHMADYNDYNTSKI